MKRVLENYRFISQCARLPPQKLIHTLSNATDEQIKTVVECIANCPPNAAIDSFIITLQTKKHNVLDIKQLLLKNKALVRSCVCTITYEILSCALQNLKDAELYESDST